MKIILLLSTVVSSVAAAALLTSSGSANQVAKTPPGPARVPVVVELFTSEGCSSCPAADAALRELEMAQSVPGVEVIALGEHVDYWNRLGWKDPFSSAQFTERQRTYAAGFGTGSYTPQAVVNGRYEFVGSQRGKLTEAIARAAQAPRATVQLSRAITGKLAIKVDALPAGTAPTEVLLALTETSLSTQVGRGENSGRLLRHAAVVRELRPLGSPAADGTFAASVPLQLNPVWKTANLRAVVLVQEKASRRIVGVGVLGLNSALSEQ
ncbi:DUF1223 domain-containing protein [Hymenobacter actinosclerus]|uniref:DUF1223 domain-containing protein n=1 Tax=Hymenobacter actinosclerus TaxID=82805 RepID=A0A1I0J6E1_9BACT|nr:DUF1223 domain-containing protein [Hymenobacter actinosclerus]SEU05364.1 hypothetical protein SAMN04487998_3660 [Hymenobacter actinosclerus]